MPRLACRLCLVLVPAALALAGLGAVGKDDLAVDATVRMLKTALEPRPGAVNALPMLSSLRQLGDPSLRPYFYQLARHDDPMVRVHAVLGLAENDPNGRLDPWMIKRIELAEAQFGTVVNGIEANLIGEETLRDLAGGEGLSPSTRALVIASQAGRGEPLNLEMARALLTQEEPITAGLAACVLSQQGDVEPLERHRASLGAMEARARRDHLVELLALIDLLHLATCAPFVEAVVLDPDVDPVVAHVGLRAALSIDPARGAALWSRTLGDDPSYSRLVRHALTLLGAPATVPAKTWDRLPGDDPLLERLAAAGRARATGKGAAAAMIALIDLGHPTATEVALEVTEALDDAEAARVYTHVIDAVEGAPEGIEERVRRAVVATTKLAEIDPDTALSRLRAARDDSSTQEALLMGLLGARNADIGQAADELEHVGFSRPDTLALLLVAKHADELDEESLYRLGVIAAGGGTVSDMLRIQAGWLYLKHADLIEQALTAAFARGS